MFKKMIGFMGLSLLLFLLVACSNTNGESDIIVSDAWIRPGQGGGPPTAAYMVIQNTGEGTDRLLNISANFSDILEIHETQVVDDVARMVPKENGVEIPANSIVEFKPGGLHIMIMQLEEELTAGEEVELILTFENAGEITISATVQE